MADACNTDHLVYAQRWNAFPGARLITTSAGLPRFPDRENNGKIFYVYAHHCKTDGRVFYIGKGKGSRALDRRGRNKRWQNTQRKHGRDVVLLKEGMSEGCAFALERALIAVLKPPCNYGPGGEGNAGIVHSPEQRARQSAVLKGIPKSPEHRAAMRGRIVTEETRRKISEAQRGKVISEAAIAKKRDNKPLTLEHDQHGVVSMPPWRFAKEYGLRRSAISSVKYGRRISVGGWRKPGVRIPTSAGSDNGMFDARVYEFRHTNGETILSTRSAMIKKYALLDSRVSDLIKGKRRTHKGWSVTRAQRQP